MELWLNFNLFGGNTVWNYTTSNIGNDLTGTNLFKQFKSVAILRENHRVDHNDKDSVLFEGFLSRLRRGDSTEDDLHLVRKKCSRYAMESNAPGSWDREGFSGADTIHLHKNNNEVKVRNDECMGALDKPVAYIKANNSSPKAASSSDKYTQGLESSMYLCVHAKVILTYNLMTNFGLLYVMDQLVLSWILCMVPAM